MLNTDDFSILQKTVFNRSTSNNLTVIPIKDFNNSKSRLRDCLSNLERIELIKAMMTSVFTALDLRCIAVTNSIKVSEFVAMCGVPSLKVDVEGLNSTANHLYQNLNIKFFNRLTIVHADIPFASKDKSPNKYVDELAEDEFLIYPDVNKLGTPVISVPINRHFKFMYGKQSFKKHVFQIESLKARLRIVEDSNWSFDIDTESDLIKYNQLTKVRPK